MRIEISIGELLDKLSVLEIKRENIGDPMKQAEIRKELVALDDAGMYRERFAMWYTVLRAINTHIWNLTNTLKSRTTIDEAYAHNAHQIMDFNQRRFRIKNILNMAEESSLKEQKSYDETSIVVDGGDVATVVYAATLYDRVYLSTPNDTCTKAPFYSAELSAKPVHVTIPEHERHLYTFPPIRYVSGGMLGDFIHQLSVVYETYLRTGRKGIVYIADIGGPFWRGAAGTFDDIRHVILSQSYIESFSVYNGESVDVNLSTWRGHPNLYQNSWSQIFEDTYHVPWGVHTWIQVTPATQFKDITFISMTPNRPCEDLDFAYILSKIKGTAVFLSTEAGQETYFLHRFKLESIPVLRVHTFQELASAIAGCTMFIGTLSMPLALADAMGVNRIALMPSSDDRLIAVKTPKPYIYTMSDAHRILL